MVFGVSKGRVTITVFDIMTVVTVPSLDGFEVRLGCLTAASWHLRGLFRYQAKGMQIGSR